MELIDIGGHTIDKSILGNGCIIDVGCRGFVFADSELFKEKKIYCLDPDKEIFEEREVMRSETHTAIFRPMALHNLAIGFNAHFPNGFSYMNLAISDKSGEATYYKNGEATCLQEKWHGHRDDQYGTCKTITMEQLYEITGENVDVLKLDCEGGEYIILGETFKPIPKQITVEFHYHCFPEKHNAAINGILERLKKDYDAVNLVWEQKHGAGFNFWDVLFIRKW